MNPERARVNGVRAGVEKEPRAPRADAGLIRQGLDLLFEPGEVFELRALGGKLKHTLSGYFDNHDAAVEAALRAVNRGAEGVYVTLNPVEPALLARARNRLVEAKRGLGTADKDVAKRRWLLVDLDPARASGISSTDAEHEAALERARQIADWLGRAGFPNPVMADSGNGAHLLYRIDLPVEDGGLLKRFLGTLDIEFSDGMVKVDTSTFNAARICKLYGTPARKGDSTADRPHRLSRLLDIPQDMEHVSRGAIEDVAELVKYSSEPAVTGGDAGVSEARRRLGEWGIEVVEESPYGEATRLILRQCPFGEHRREGKSAVFVSANGRLGFKCFSDEHIQYGWKDLRQRFEPDLAAQAAPWPEGDGAAPELAPEPSAWPEPVEDAALYGLPGEFVHLVYPHTEADPAALLVHYLVMFGNIVGRGPHRLAGGQKHHLNEFALIVGETSRGAKGTALAEAQRPFEIAALDWFGARIAGGLSSGEGLIWHVRDRSFKREPVKEKGRYTGEYQEVEADAGEPDKRLMVVETEFSQALKVMRREGNTLSEILRKAWDGQPLRSLVRNNPYQAREPHVSIVGHITPDELKVLLDSVSAANGFGNRFLFVCSRRSKLLPWGGSTIDARIPCFADRTKAAAEQARKIGEFRFAEGAGAIWEREYGRLREGGDGLLGAIIGRAAAHVIRLACIYAATDAAVGNPGGIISEQHLQAALALWDYCERSARCLFGDRYGDPVADTIIDTLGQRPGGMTLWEINDLFSGHHSTAEIQARKRQLLRCGRITVSREQTGGRPVERWRLVR